MSFSSQCKLVFILLLFFALFNLFRHNPFTVDIAALRNDLGFIAIQREPGTLSNAAVRQFLATRLANMGLIVDLHRFNDSVPKTIDDSPGSRNRLRPQEPSKPQYNGSRTVEFVNIIASSSIHPKSRLILAAHYDSIAGIDGFTGAMDSAASCLVLIEVAARILKHCRDDFALNIVLFDGEEAFVKWSNNDFLYGSRNLARFWHESNIIREISLFILLDLLGSKSQQPVENLYPELSQDLFGRLAYHDSHVPRTSTRQFVRMINNNPNDKRLEPMKSYSFDPKSLRLVVADDHEPFARLGVPFLHLIPLPFPDEWHNSRDNIDNIDFDKIVDWIYIVACFSGEFMGINVPFCK